MRRFSKPLAACLLMLTAISVWGCAATVAMTPESEDLYAKKFEPLEGKANVYLYRPSDFGAAVLFQVAVDGLIKGSIADGTYYLFEVDPGKHKVAVFAPEKQVVVEIETEANQSYFLKVTPEWGWAAARVGVEEVLEAEAREAILKLGRVESM